MKLREAHATQHNRHNIGHPMQQLYNSQTWHFPFIIWPTSWKRWCCVFAFAFMYISLMFCESLTQYWFNVVHYLIVRCLHLSSSISCCVSRMKMHLLKMSLITNHNDLTYCYSQSDDAESREPKIVKCLIAFVHSSQVPQPTWFFPKSGEGLSSSQSLCRPFLIWWGKFDIGLFWIHPGSVCRLALVHYVHSPIRWLSERPWTSGWIYFVWDRQSWIYFSSNLVMRRVRQKLVTTSLSHHLLSCFHIKRKESSQNISFSFTFFQ